MLIDKPTKIKIVKDHLNDGITLKGLKERYGMNAVLSNLANYDEIVVWVLKGNEKTIRFYEKYGFVFDGREAKIIMDTTNTELRMVYKRNQ